MSGALPNLVVIGAMKCGTSSLHRYLDAHPQIAMSEPKELNFFVRCESKKIYSSWHRGLDWYRGHFNPEAAVRGESSPNYTTLPTTEGTAERMHSVIPDAKLIYLVRDPIERMISHYLHHKASAGDDRPMGEAFAEPENRYLRRSRYATQLAEFLRFYPRERIHVTTQEALLANRRQTIARVLEFLGVDPTFWSPHFDRLWEVSRGKDRKFSVALKARRRLGSHGLRWLPVGARWAAERVVLHPIGTGVERPPLDDDLRAELVEALRPEVEALRELTGIGFAAWDSGGP